ncbi:MAG: glycosyltransferase family 1 protein [Proteobacteria bacterium]|nr:glycosyltransferase family 1 protein [Pseudomonadota bacterium]
MRICDISSFFSEQGGGVRTYHMEKLAYFSRHPEHDYIMIIAGPRGEVTDVDGGRIYRVRGIPVSKGAVYRQIIDLSAIRRIIKRERPDVIEIGSTYLDGWLGLAAGIGREIATVGFYHADFPDSYMAPAVAGFPKKVSERFVSFWRRYVRFAYRYFDATCVTSKYIEEKLDSYGLSNIVRIPLGVDCERFHPIRRNESLRSSLGIESNEKMLLYAGRLSTEKGIQQLIDSIVHVSGQHGIKTVIVGSGPLEQLVREKTAELVSVKLLGYEKDPKRLAALYASADIFLAPGPYETFGLSALEALASGVPVVAPSSGGTGELISESNGGLLFKPNDSNDLTRCIEELLQSDLKTIGQGGRRFAEQEHSWNQTFNRMVHLYEEIINEKRIGHTVAA